MKQTFFLLEDNIEQSFQLETWIRQFSEPDDDFDVITAASVEEAKNRLKEVPAVEAFLLDISMDGSPKNNEGLAFAGDLHAIERYKNKPIIFITAYSSFLSTALNDLHCYAFLLKPYTKEQLYKQLSDLTKTDPTSLLIKNLDNIYVHIPLEHLLYIQSNGRYLSYVSINSTIVSRQFTLTKVLEKLPDNFLRCHKSFVVNAAHIRYYDFSNQLLSLTPPQIQVPVGKKFQQDFI